jgi:hypothetical protein
MPFAELMIAASDSKNSRNASQWTTQACKIWREAEPEDARLLEAAIAWELASGRRTQPRDEIAVRERRRQIDAITAAMRAAKEG